MENLSFNEWNQEQQYFGSILYLKILTIQEVYDFCCSLIYRKVNYGTKKEKDELNSKKEGIKRFMKIISNIDYIKTYLKGATNIGDLYKKETSEKIIKNISNKNVNYKTK